ncbi:MAG: flagellar filament capping protein FliD [Paucibacter sp.]|nr:flagellar filament capping protein FliD [Roseateles sp.]
MSATITSLGIGTNGLDLESLLSKQVAAESQPLTDLQNLTQGLQTKLSAYGQVQGAMSNLQTALQALTNPGTWNSVNATSSDPASVSVTAGDGATAGNVSVSVSQLATSQTVASTPYPNTTDALGSGSLTIQLGQWSSDMTTFTAGSSGPATVNIAAGSTLTSIRDQINAANAGVTASIVTDSSGSRLVMSSTATGQNAGFKITANDADGNNTDASGISAFAFDPSSGVNSMTQKVAAGNAKAVVNGLDIESQSNTLTGVVSGLSITLNKTTTNAAITVAQNSGTAQSAINTFVASYNAMAQLFATDTKYDAGTKVAGPLQGDSATIGLQYMMRTIAGGSTTLGGAFSRLADIGLDPQADGTLKVDSTKLTSGLNNLADLKNFFMGTDKSNSSNSGLAQQLQGFVDGALSIDGQLSSAQQGLQSRINLNNTRANDLQSHIDLFSQRLRDRYNALDTQMSSLNSLASYVNQQMTILNNNAH